MTMDDNQYKTFMTFMAIAMCVLLGGTMIWASGGRDDDDGERYSRRHRSERSARSYND
jgi:hypothetical protein